MHCQNLCDNKMAQLSFSRHTKAEIYKIVSNVGESCVFASYFCRILTKLSWGYFLLMHLLSSVVKFVFI